MSPVCVLWLCQGTCPGLSPPAPAGDTFLPSAEPCSLGLLMPGQPLHCSPSSAREERNSQKSSWFLGANQSQLSRDFALDGRAHSGVRLQVWLSSADAELGSQPDPNLQLPFTSQLVIIMSPSIFIFFFQITHKQELCNSCLHLLISPVIQNTHRTSGDLRFYDQTVKERDSLEKSLFLWRKTYFH